MKFFIRDFFCKYNQIRRLVAFTEEILHGKLHFLCVVKNLQPKQPIDQVGSSKSGTEISKDNKSIVLNKNWNSSKEKERFGNK